MRAVIELGSRTLAWHVQGAKFHLGFLKGEGCWRERYSGLLKNYSETNTHLYDGAALILLKYSVTEMEAVAQILWSTKQLK